MSGPNSSRSAKPATRRARPTTCWSAPDRLSAYGNQQEKGVIHLRAVQLLPPRAGQPEDDGYPFVVPAVASLRAASLEFDAPVTFLVGENGSGKSAILEGLACAAGSIAIAGDDPRRDPTLVAARALGDRLRLTWRARTQRGFFLRAEDFRSEEHTSELQSR